jgi:aspartyl-tRNA(Asn)/glutamyl-tRNA(Gln) amidotransferase subunit A
MSVSVGLTARDLAARVARRELRAEDVAAEHLARIEALDGEIGSFLLLLGERALERARRLDAELDAGAEPPPLAGVPFAVKDLFAIDGTPTTCGSRLLEGYRPPYTATAVARLEAAGAICLGKTNMDEFAMGSSNENSGYRPVRNPWDTRRVPGGSSGGSAAAVAARMVPFALGTDTGGSIRQPAAFCGVVGLKPSYGRVSRWGMVAFASSLDQAGPLARSVGDVALAAGPLCGHDPRDATSDARPAPDLEAARTRDLRGLRVGLPAPARGEGVSPAVASAFEEALAALSEAGALVVDVELPHAEHAIAAYYLVATAEASSNLARFDGVRYGRRVEGPGGLAGLYGATRDAGFGDEVKRRILLGTFALSAGYRDAYYLQAQKVRSLIRLDYEKAFERCDVIATPTAPTPPFLLGEKTADPLEMYLADVFTVPANLAGLPALSLPCGLAEGLPAGLQFVAPAFDEESLIRAAAGFEAVTSHHQTGPPIA